MADFLMEQLEGLGISRKNALRLRLSAEEILLTWQASDKMAEVVAVEITRRFHRLLLTVSCAGMPLDPTAETGDEDFGTNLLGRSLLEQLGLFPVWSYRNGVNTVSTSVKLPSPIGQSVQVVLAIGLSVILGLLFQFLPQTFREGLLTGLLDPLFDTLLNILSCIVGPMMFLSVAWGIFNIGDARQLGIIGKKLLSRFLIVSVVIGVISMLAGLLLWQIRPVDSGGGIHGVQALLEMVLGIIPKDIITPFAEGNTLQLLFLGIVLGVAMMLLRNKLPILGQVLEQGNTLVQYILSGISVLIPGFVFLSLFRMMLAGTLMHSLGGLLSAIALCVAIIFLHLLVKGALLTRYGVSFKTVLRKLAPPVVVALSTASSAAAYEKTVHCCEKEMGIDKKLASFAIPLGSVLYMPHGIALFVVISLFCAQSYGVTMSTEGLIMCVFTSVVLSIASPPIPGGGLTCYALLFAQMGIPMEALSLAIAADVILDFACTAGDVGVLIADLTMGAKRLNMLNADVLRKE